MPCLSTLHPHSLLSSSFLLHAVFQWPPHPNEARASLIIDLQGVRFQWHNRDPGFRRPQQQQRNLAGSCQFDHPKDYVGESHPKVGFARDNHSRGISVSLYCAAALWLQQPWTRNMSALPFNTPPFPAPSLSTQSPARFHAPMGRGRGCRNPGR